MDYRFIPDLVRRMEEGGHDVVSGTRYGLGGGVRVGFPVPDRFFFVVFSLLLLSSSSKSSAVYLQGICFRARAVICSWR